MEAFSTQPHYRAAAGFGIILIAVGIATNSYSLMGAGLVFLIIGLVKRRKAEKA